MEKHSEEYVRYLRSREWQQKRLAALRRTLNTCEVCGIKKHRENLEVHHKTYERLGNERGEDLMVVCIPCHKQQDIARRSKQADRRYNRRLDAWASKRYGKDWESFKDWEQVASEFDEWLDRKMEDGL